MTSIPEKPKRHAWNKRPIDPLVLRDLYINQRLTVKQVGEALKIAPSSIRHRLREFGIPVRSNSEAGMGKTPHNKRGWVRHKDGYTLVCVPSESPYAPMRSKGGYVLNHRLVMAQHLGRCLEPWEIVHHIDHDRQNDALENLELIQGSTTHLAETFSHDALLALKAENAELRAYIAELESRLMGED